MFVLAFHPTDARSTRQLEGIARRKQSSHCVNRENPVARQAVRKSRRGCTDEAGGSATLPRKVYMRCRSPCRCHRDRAGVSWPVDPSPAASSRQHHPRAGGRRTLAGIHARKRTLEERCLMSQSLNTMDTVGRSDFWPQIRPGSREHRDPWVCSRSVSILQAAVQLFVR